MNVDTVHVPSYVVVDASVSLKWTFDDAEAVAEAVSLRDAAIAGRHVLAITGLS